MKKIAYIILSIVITINILFLGYNIYNKMQINKKVNINNVSIKLKGENNIKININDKYEENGAEVIINNKQKDAKIDGTIDTSKIATYLIRYYSDMVDYNIYRKVEIKDDEKPVIKLKGSSTINMYVGEKYKEQGVVVSDNSKENLNGKVTIKGEVKNKKVGKYNLTYSVSDSSGNTASITRKVNVKNRPIVKKIEVTKVSKTEKGATTTKKIDLNKNTNAITSMKFTNSGINISGYVKNGNGNYSIKLCNGTSCETTKMNSSKTKYYSGNIKLDNLSNGTYAMKLIANNEMDIIDELPENQRIVRAKVGNKLITVTYNKNRPTIKIENFEYQYDILIDAGHGGSDNGARNSKITEKVLNLEQSLYEKKRYEQHGLRVKMIRTDDSYGLMMGSSSEARVHRRGYAMGYYGTVSKYVYSNHHNSIGNDYYSGYEIILANQGNSSIYSVPYKIAGEWKSNYPVGENHLRIYGRNYDTDSLLDKGSYQTYNIRNYYAVIRIPYELYNVYTVIYEGCYLSNHDDYNWYSNNWKKMSEIKIKAYVESLGKEYIPNGDL